MHSTEFPNLDHCKFKTITAFLAGSEDLCELVRELLSAGAYEPWIQVSGWVGANAWWFPSDLWNFDKCSFFLKDLIAAAQYWHDPLNNTNYAQGPPFLPDWNQFWFFDEIFAARISLLGSREQWERGEGGAVQVKDVTGEFDYRETTLRQQKYRD